MSFFTSTIGRKFIMALTGICLMGFVLAHLIGNFQVFLGQDAFNAYAAFLKSIPGPLWAARLGLLFVFILHLATALSLQKTNRSARKERYKKPATVQATPSSLYMMETGIVILLFVLFHLAHFTFGFIQPEYFHLMDAKGRHDVYSILVHGFQNAAFSGAYLFCLLVLAVHLHHAFQSVVQTLGLNHPVYTPALRKIGAAFAIFVFLGYGSIPLAVLGGVLKLPFAS